MENSLSNAMLLMKEFLNATTYNADQNLTLYYSLLYISHLPAILKRVNNPLQMKLMPSDAPHAKRHLTDMIRTLTHLHVKLPAAAAAAETASTDQ